ncbi:glycosyltransferase family 39 protein [Sphingobium sp. AN641]|uniref:ArnT family glycosyltransferase n=1 Tax=Sphingobium sp. AN641 TaxID=3133443 RepID=UPI0030BC279D
MRVQGPFARGPAILLFGILLLAVVTRLQGIGFGLPALYDPDEPLFALSAVKLLAERTLNPGWFGHPGTTTIYGLALVDILVVGVSLLTGRFDSLHAITTAAYADPGILILPGRVSIMLCGVASVYMTWRIGKRLGGEGAGLVAAGLLAINAVHIAYSQIIRTDIQASLFMLLCLNAAIGVAQTGRLRAYLVAGALAGAACATKWPAASVFVCVIGACTMRCAAQAGVAGGDRRGEIMRLALSALAAVAALLVISPYILIDVHTVVANLSGEAQAHHVGATGRGLAANLGWYLRRPLGGSMGAAGLVVAAAGMVLVLLRGGVARATLLPIALLFFILISAQTLIWERWAVPLLPLAALFTGLAVSALVTWARAKGGRPAALAVAAVMMAALVPPAMSALAARATERAHDTRALASAWVRDHVPAGSRIVLEHLAFDLLDPKWTFLLPAGDRGCLEASGQLEAKAGPGALDSWRGKRAVVDFGTMDEGGLPSCRADFAVFSHYDRYKAEGALYAREAARYERFVRGGRLRATFRPEQDRIGGPFIRIVDLRGGRSR